MEKTCRSFPREVSDIISSFEMGVHPVAGLIKDLSFEYLPEMNIYGPGIYRPARLAVTASPWVSFAVTEGRFSSRSPWVTSSPNCRFFALSDFGSPPRYDQYIEYSNIASGLLIGRVLE